MADIITLKTRKKIIDIIKWSKEQSHEEQVDKFLKEQEDYVKKMETKK